MENSDVVEVNQVLEHLSCPICFEIPEAEVYQCVDGHEICKKCHSQLTECPQCRVPFDPFRPIRNRHFERLLESFKVSCSITGCNKRLSRNLISEHEKSCCFNFEKYGNFVPLCNLIGYTDCSSLANNGNSEEIANHLISIHGCMQSKGNEFCLALLDFRMDIPGQQFWTPVISNLKDKQCYLMTFAVLDTVNESFGLTSVFLPYLKNPSIGLQEIKFEFSIANEEGDVWKHVQVPMSLKKVAEWLSSAAVPFPFKFSWINSHSKNSRVFIKCKIKLDGEQLVKNVGGHEGVEQFVCAKHSSIVPKNEGVLRWNNHRRSPVAHDLFYRKWTKVINKNGNFTEIQQIFSIEENEQNLPGVAKEDVKWLSLGALFLTAQCGTFNDLRLLIDKNVNVCVVNEKGATPLHLAVLDTERTRGLKKAKLLVEKPEPNRVGFVLKTEVYSILL